MHSITPCQRKVTDRFPVASFVVNVPSHRLFEIVCTTDPLLLQPSYKGRRTENNFYTSRSSGLLRAPAGHATYLVPPNQLKRFAGNQRVYYALATYENSRGENAQVSIAPGGSVPSIQLSGDFTGRTLDRSRLRGGVRDDRYGGQKSVLTWGGDTAPLHSASATAVNDDYDDGFSRDLWTKTETTTTTTTTSTVEHRADEDEGEPEPDIVWDEPGLGEAYGRPVARSSATMPGPLRSTTAVDEPEGFEDATALRRGNGAYERVAPAGSTEFSGFRSSDGPAQSLLTYGFRNEVVEPPGVEHVEHRPHFGATAVGPSDTIAPSGAVVPNSGVAPPPEPAGSEDVRGMSPAASTSAVTTTTSSAGVATQWDDDDDEIDLVASPTSDGQPLTIRRKFEILAPAASYESGDQRYSAVLGNVDGHGLHWGLVLFTQRSGALGRVLNGCERRDPNQFRQTFGAAQADRLLQVTTATTPDERLAAVGSAPLWSADWIDKFRLAGSIPAFQAAQNEVAVERYFDRNLGFATALGLTTDRALAVVFACAIHMGIAGARRWILRVTSPITDDAKRAMALAVLGYADVGTLQSAASLQPTGNFGTQTHSALLSALRNLGPKSPFAMPSTHELLDAIGAAATGTSLEPRVSALLASTAYSDAVQQVI